MEAAEVRTLANQTGNNTRQLRVADGGLTAPEDAGSPSHRNRHFEIEVPGHLSSKSNARGHWIHAHRLARKQRETILGLVAMKLGSGFEREVLGMKVDRRTGCRELKTRIRLRSPWAERLERGLVVTFTRKAPRRLDSDDNLRDAFKSVKDGVAEAFGITDANGEKRVAWQYSPQVIASPSSYVVRVEWKEPEAAECP